MVHHYNLLKGVSGNHQTILLARRTRTIRMCSLDARSERQSGSSLPERNERALKDHLCRSMRAVKDSLAAPLFKSEGGRVRDSW
jgi:hypothetical protein